MGSALGFFTAPRAFDLVRSHKISLKDADFAEIEEIFQAMEKEGAAVIQKAGTAEKIQYDRSLEMRFIGQGSETNVPIVRRNFTEFPKDEVRRLFDEVYKVLYGRTYLESEVEFVSYRVRAKLPERSLQLPKIEKRVSSVEGAIKGERLAYSPIARDFIPFSVYDRYSLFPGAQFHGPAIIEERESTVIVGEDASVSMDDYGFLWINFEEA